MTDLAALRAVIAELKKAAGPSGVLDLKIGHIAWESGWPGINDWANPPLYSDSLDAALTLVPEGCWWRAQNIPSEPRASAIIGSEECHEEVDEAPSPALALCLAACRARLALAEKEQGT